MHDRTKRKAIQKLKDTPKFADAQVSRLSSQLESKIKAKHDSLLVNIKENQKLAFSDSFDKTLTLVAAVVATFTAFTLVKAVMRG